MFGSGWGGRVGGVFWESTGIRENLVVWTGISRSGADKLGSSGTRKAVFRGIWKVSASKPRWNNVTNPIFFFQPPSAAILDWFVLFQNRYCDILKVICLDYSPSHNNKHYNDIVPQSCIDSTMLSVCFRKKCNDNTDTPATVVYDRTTCLFEYKCARSAPEEKIELE